jgi:hypothetical protein
MTNWLIRIRRAGLMGMAWAAAWVPVGSVVGWMIVGELEPEWIGGPLYAGFVCGAVFASVAGIAGGRRRLDEMSLTRAGARGAVSGLLVGSLWLVVVLLSDPPLWLLEGGVVGALTILSAVSGIGSALLGRMGKNNASAHVA